jgi:hypothetical protein
MPENWVENKSVLRRGTNPDSSVVQSKHIHFTDSAVSAPICSDDYDDDDDDDNDDDDDADNNNKQ